MTTLTTALLGPISSSLPSFPFPTSLLRIFFPFSYPTSTSPPPSNSSSPPPQTTPTLPASKSDSLCTARPTRHRHAQGGGATRRPQSAAGAVEGHWRWAGPESGVILHYHHHQHAEEKEPGLKTLADVQVSHPSPVFACRPRRVRTYYPAPEESARCDDAVDAVMHALDSRERIFTLSTTSDDDSSFDDTDFDISLISATSASSSSFDGNADSDTSFSSSSFVLPPPPAPPHPRANNPGLGINGLCKADGSPFDGMGVVSFGAHAEPESSTSSPRRRAPDILGLSRAFLEEAERTWAADPHHRMLSVIEEEELEEGEGEEGVMVSPRVESRRSDVHTTKNKTKTKTTRPIVRKRDLSALDTISSGLKRRQNSRDRLSPQPKPKPSSSSSGPLRRSPSKEPSGRPRTPLPVWHR
ncbi:hypothetical protein R3P38DRAFT_3343181 [Favolaschia claudopus]|uniref:Uncharacterized protein n=1 Tax=Favolaschia claudopus TaxID=2862362 RepID=A0AAW0DRA4_9AGAR